MKIEIRVDDGESKALAARAQRSQPSGAPLSPDPTTSAVQFLRGVSSRATFVLPAFYLFLGANSQHSDVCSVSGYPGLVLKHAMRFSSINTITLCCRKAFDHAANGLTGAAFAKSSDETLCKVAEYWANSSARSAHEANSALALLRTSSRLLAGTTTLGKRIGLLKQHADRSAAHLTLENYEFSTLDCAHVVGALTLIGEIIRSFDDASAGSQYFDELDEAARAAARSLFPQLADIRLFGHMKIAEQARGCWKHDLKIGQHMLFEQLPYATGWF